MTTRKNEPELFNTPISEWAQETARERDYEETGPSLLEKAFSGVGVTIMSITAIFGTMAYYGVVKPAHEHNETVVQHLKHVASALGDTLKPAAER